MNKPGATYHLLGPEEWVGDSPGLVGLTLTDMSKARTASEPNVCGLIFSSQPYVLGTTIFHILFLKKLRHKEVNN